MAIRAAMDNALLIIVAMYILGILPMVFATATAAELSERGYWPVWVVVASTLLWPVVTALAIVAALLVAVTIAIEP